MRHLVRQFEEKLESILGGHVVATNSGTSALIAALWALDVRGKEVITTPYTYQATANAIVIAGGIPVFADIKNNWLIDENDVKKKITSKTAAILPVHLGGTLCDIQALKKLSGDNQIGLVEDCAQSFLFELSDETRPIPRHIKCYSFYESKNMSTFEGGAVQCVYTGSDYKNLPDKIRAICSNGETSPYNFDYVGFNFRMNPLAAVVGLERLNRHYEAVAEGNELKFPQYKKLVYQHPSMSQYATSCPNAERLVKQV